MTSRWELDRYQREGEGESDVIRIVKEPLLRSKRNEGKERLKYKRQKKLEKYCVLRKISIWIAWQTTSWQMHQNCCNIETVSCSHVALLRL